MKLLAPIALGAMASTAVAVVLPQRPLLPSVVKNEQQTRWLIELAPYETRWVTEEEKWALKLDGVNFIDVTNEFRTGSYGALHTQQLVRYPSKMERQQEVAPLAADLSKDNMRKNLEHFTSFHTRYYKSETGIQSAEWLLEQVQGVVDKSGASDHGAKVHRFDHPWGQFSIIARIPGKSNNTVVLGSHQDSINLFLPSILAAPGADDDGSGTVTILETLRALLRSETIAKGHAENTIEFHWYSAEEGGLLGSQAVYSRYRKERRNVKAMLQQDMTGYSQGTLDAGLPESVGVIVDYVDQGLTKFIKEVITSYCDIPYVETKCGYACSDHASASRFGYPSAFVIESRFENSDKKIHTTEDQIKYLSFDHMLQHAKMSLAFAYELAFAPF
ncbi:Leucine aminopeptidase 1 [Penicillium capsulatum]|uniref:Peptide hydrolase n=1 Tax=Penicillium capsulatum TaxID=69766 RepID=A0A9W9I042_9EURO|nr:Leucine aminopeptidase 1 [Penicillium capsulatum]KAJ6116666.1 Leucine aminopeptidase 1 [Penicillium capsulatum]